MDIVKVRADKYLWSIRVFKTRTLASNACAKGKVKIGGDNVKASRTINIGDKIDVTTDARTWNIEVIGLIEKRVKFSEAIENYIDNTPEELKTKDKPMATSFYTGKRLSKVGRPTKRQRRDLDDFLE
jgi:ribosome-associated heat shock protein Hsp15